MFKKLKPTLLSFQRKSRPIKNYNLCRSGRGVNREIASNKFSNGSALQWDTLAVYKLAYYYCCCYYDKLLK